MDTTIYANVTGDPFSTRRNWFSLAYKSQQILNTRVNLWACERRLERATPTPAPKVCQDRLGQEFPKFFPFNFQAQLNLEQPVTSMAEQTEDVAAMLRDGMRILAENDPEMVPGIQDHDPLILFFPDLNVSILLQLFLADVAAVLDSPCLEALMNLDTKTEQAQRVAPSGAFAEEEENQEEEGEEESAGERFLQLDVDPSEFPVVYDFACGFLERETPSIFKWCSESKITLETMPLSAGEVLYEICSANPSDMPLIRYLLDYKLDANHISKHGTIVFNGIVMKQRHDLLDLFIEYGVDYVCDNLGRSPLHCCAKTKNLEIAEVLLDAGGADPDIPDWQGRTPLHIAARLGDCDMVALLCDYEANVDAQDEFGLTPLHYASAYGRVRVLDLLYDYQADIFAIDAQCMNGMNIAVLRKKKASIKWFSDHGVTNDNMAGERDSLKKGKVKDRKEIRKMMRGNGK